MGRVILRGQYSIGYIDHVNIVMTIIARQNPDIILVKAIRHHSTIWPSLGCHMIEIYNRSISRFKRKWRINKESRYILYSTN